MDTLIAGLNAGEIRSYSKASVTQTAGRFASMWTATGIPAAGSAAGSAAGAACTKATAGAIPFSNTASGYNYLARLFAQSANPCTIVIYDRLLHTSALVGNLNTAQTVNSVTLPSRPDTTGANTELWMEVYTALGSTATTITASYTDQSGGSPKTSGAGVVAGTAQAGYMARIPLATGDGGVRSVQTVTLAASTGTAGNFGITILRRLAEIYVPAANLSMALDAIALGLPRIYDDACLAVMVCNNTSSTGTVVSGLTIAKG